MMHKEFNYKKIILKYSKFNLILGFPGKSGLNGIPGVKGNKVRLTEI